MRCDNAECDAVVDQIVDEVMSRLRSLDPALAAGVDVTLVRASATEIAWRLTRGRDPRAARVLINVLWSGDRGGRPPLAWWHTPLGRTLRRIAGADVAAASPVGPLNELISAGPRYQPNG
jgi:hypothetical protein